MSRDNVAGRRLRGAGSFCASCEENAGQRKEDEGRGGNQPGGRARSVRDAVILLPHADRSDRRSLDGFHDNHIAVLSREQRLILRRLLRRHAHHDARLEAALPKALRLTAGRRPADPAGHHSSSEILADNLITRRRHLVVGIDACAEAHAGGILEEGEQLRLTLRRIFQQQDAHTALAVRTVDGADVVRVTVLIPIRVHFRGVRVLCRGGGREGQKQGAQQQGNDRK